VGSPPLPGTEPDQQPAPATAGSGSAQTGCAVDRPAAGELRSWLELLRQVPFDRTWVYPSFADLVLARGRLFPPAPWARAAAQQPGRCFAAAHHWTDLEDGWTYCEGYALVPSTMPFPAIEHAWCLTTDGRVADPALPDG
jgi:hypothetical protein